jgi:hypothetical protein
MNLKMNSDAQKVLDDWLGDEADVIHFWEDFNIYYVLAKTKHDNVMLCLRVFFIEDHPSVPGKWHLSQDKTFKMMENET